MWCEWVKGKKKVSWLERLEKYKKVLLLPTFTTYYYMTFKLYSSEPKNNLKLSSTPEGAIQSFSSVSHTNYRFLHHHYIQRSKPSLFPRTEAENILLNNTSIHLRRGETEIIPNNREQIQS